MNRSNSIRLPPLPALRAFEAVARLASVRDAAEELRLTPSAISHQLRNLEEHLGMPLFNRGNQTIELTAAGEQFAAYVQRGFRELTQGVAALRSNSERSVLRVSVAPMFAMEILLPALAEFERVCPDVQLRLDVGESLVNFDNEPIDAAIRIGKEPVSTLFHETLLEVCWAPVCSPRLLQSAGSLQDPEDLRAHVLIDSNDHYDDSPWQMWFTKVGLAEFKPTRQLRFDTFLGTLQAAESGLGLIMAPLPMVARHLAEGRLVAPFDALLPSPWPYRFVCRRGQERQPKIDRFRRWLAVTCAAHAELLPSHCPREPVEML